MKGVEQSGHSKGKFMLLVALLTLGLSFTLRASMTFAAWTHNPQGEFFNAETGELEPFALGTVFLSWFVVGILSSLALILSIYFEVNCVKCLWQNNSIVGFLWRSFELLVCALKCFHLPAKPIQ